MHPMYTTKKSPIQMKCITVTMKRNVRQRAGAGVERRGSINNKVEIE
jgi:hypothetical protein